jgi:tetratricopeptide (TPR) repeat protein
LHRFLADEPIKARPVTAVELYWRWCRRNRWLAFWIASAALLLVAIAATSAASYFRIRSEKAETERQFARAEENARLQTAARQEADHQKLLARGAERKAADSAALAGKQRGIALDTLYSLVTKVEDRLRDKEGMADLRKDVLGVAMDGLNKVTQSAENSPLADRSMGVALQRMGDVCEQIGKTDDAIRQYESSLKIFDRLEKGDPRNDWLPWNRAVSYDKLASLSQEHKGDARAALEYFRKSLAIREALVARQNTPAPAPEARKAALGVSHIKLAELCLSLGDPPSALESARKAWKENHDLLGANPDNAQARRFLALSSYLVGKASAHLGKLDEAKMNLDESLVARRSASNADPKDAAAKRELGAAYDALGDTQVEQGKPQEAAGNYERSRGLYLALVKNEPDSAEDKWYLGGSYFRLGTANLLLGKDTEARREFEESLKVRTELVKTDPGSVQLQSELLLSLARCSRVEDAAKLALTMSKSAAMKNPSLLYAVASGYALCAGSVAARVPGGGELERRYAAEAMRMLSEAVALGYRDAEALRLDPNLEALRKLPEFKQLQNKLRSH